MSESLAIIVPAAPPIEPPRQTFSYLVVDPATHQILGVANYPHAMPDLPEDEYVLATDEQLAAVAAPGTHYLEPDGTIRTVPLPPPAITYAGARSETARARTTDDIPAEIFRYPTRPKHVYRASFRLTAVDATSGTTKDSEVRMTFKTTASALNQIGATAILYNVQDTGAAPWGVQASVQFPELVISVRGAAGRTIDWFVVADIGSYAPEGLDS